MPPEPNVAEDAIFKSIGDLKKKIQLSGKGVDYALESLNTSGKAEIFFSSLNTIIVDLRILIEI
jgi:hypothetical protein